MTHVGSTSQNTFITREFRSNRETSKPDHTFDSVQAHSDPETVPVCNAIATVMQMLGGFIGVMMYATNAPNLPCTQHILTQNTVSSAGVVFDGQLRHNLAVYAPNVDPGPITASVAAIYSGVSSAARPSVIHAYVKSVGTFHFISGGVGVN